MAVEGLVLVHPTDATKNVTLNGTKWALEELDLGNPGRREEFVASSDASGAVPFRVAPRDNREVTLRLRLIDATTMNGALDSIAALESVLEAAERFAASDTDDPVLDHVRLVYTPADSTYSFSLIVYAAEITGVPKVISGDDAGFFLKRPVVTVRAICDPFAYGAGVTSPAKTTWLTTTLSGNAVSNSVKIPASGTIAGDVSPWTRFALEDKASQVRNRVILGLRQNESNTTATIGAASLTAIVGTVSSGVMTASSNDWAIAGQLPNQTRTGTFRVYLNGATSTSTGSVRLVVAPTGSSKRTGQTVNLVSGTTIDADLGEVSADSKWDGWIETTGSVKFSNVVLVPTDSFVEVNAAAPGKQLVGRVSVRTSETNASTLENLALIAGEHSGSWDEVSATASHISPTNPWPATAGVPFRNMASMTVPAFAIAGTQNYLNVDVRATLAWGKPAGTTSDRTQTSFPFMGIVARYVNTTNYLVAGLTLELGLRFARPGLWKVIDGTVFRLWSGESRVLGGNSDGVSATIAAAGRTALQLQTTADGRYFLGADLSIYDSSIPGAFPYTKFLETTSGQDPDLAQGGVLGNPTQAKVGLYDRQSTNLANLTRVWFVFQTSSLVGVTPPPIPPDEKLTLAGPKLLTKDGAEYPYIGSSGIALRPGVNNNLTAIVRRSSTVAGTGGGATEPVDLTVDGWPRYLTVPHG